MEKLPHWVACRQGPGARLAPCPVASEQGRTISMRGCQRPFHRAGQPTLGSALTSLRCAPVRAGEAVRYRERIVRLVGMCAAPGTVSWRREALMMLTKGKDEGRRNAVVLLERTCGPPAQCFKIEVDDQPGCERGPRGLRRTCHGGSKIWCTRNSVVCATSGEPTDRD